MEAQIEVRRKFAISLILCVNDRRLCNTPIVPAVTG